MSVEVRVLETSEQIASCFPVMRQLRPDLQAETFVSQVVRQRRDGYRLAAVLANEAIAAVAGYRISENLAWGKFLYVDDLVTDVGHRSRGHGERLMEWLCGEAERAGCRELHLDSGVQRFAAHRFYLRLRMDITSHHFRIELPRTWPGEPQEAWR